MSEQKKSSQKKGQRINQTQQVQMHQIDTQKTAELDLNDEHRDNIGLRDQLNNSSSSSSASQKPAQQPVVNNNINNNQASAQNVVQPPRRGLIPWVKSNKKLILKWIMVSLLMIFAMWMGSQFLSQNLFIKRYPMFFLSSFSSNQSPKYAMAPQQSDYKSFKYYEQMVALAQKTSSQNRDPSDTQMAQFKDISFKQFYNIFKVIRTIQLAKQYSSTKKQQQQLLSPQIDINSLDQYINKTDFLSDPVDQFQCASCYSFPITATVQYLYAVNNITVKLSEQQLIDCAHDNPFANGCDDGNITKGFQYVKKEGLVSTENYPYRSITGQSYKCDKQAIDSSNAKLYKISGYRILPTGNCQAIQSELVKGNVVAAMINAGDLPKYTGGVFTDCKRFGLNHAITIVGQTQKNQWIVRNSWGKSWGNNGYFLMGHGNTCGVCTHSIVPVLKLDQKGNVLPYDPKDDKKDVKQ